MAPLPPDVVTIFPWELFTAYGVDGLPLIGGRLWTFAAETSTPKASYSDRFFVTPNSNPVVLNSDGQAVVWLDGFYHLRLEDPDGVLLWDVPSYTFQTGVPPMPPDQIITGSNEATLTPTPGASVLPVSGLVPLGYRCEGCLMRINTAFGTSNALQQIACGDSTDLSGWGLIGLDAGLTTLQKDFRRADRPIAATPYTILLSALGGLFDATGSITVKAFFSSLAGWS